MERIAAAVQGCEFQLAPPNGCKEVLPGLTIREEPLEVTVGRRREFPVPISTAWTPMPDTTDRHSLNGRCISPSVNSPIFIAFSYELLFIRLVCASAEEAQRCFCTTGGLELPGTKILAM